MKKTIIRWHNIRDNPDDLPKIPIRDWYLITFDNCKYPGIDIAFYSPAKKKFYVTTRVIEISEENGALTKSLIDPDINIPLHFIEPYGKIVAWAYMFDEKHSKFLKRCKHG